MLTYPWSCGLCLLFAFFLLAEYNQIKGFQENLLTDDTSTSILLKENFLLKSRSYQIRFRVRTEDQAEEFSEYNFRTNSPPRDGTCTIDKDTGKAVLEKFQLTCQDWDDDDQPLTYQVSIPKPDMSYIVFAVSTNSSMTLRLPVGDEKNSYTLRLDVFIVDSLLGWTKVNVSVTVSFSSFIFLFSESFTWQSWQQTVDFTAVCLVSWYAVVLLHLLLPSNTRYMHSGVSQENHVL